MPHNRYTNIVREIERAQIARQEKELAALAKELHSSSAAPMTLPVADEAKEHRRTRLEQKRRHKPKGSGAAGTDGI